MSEGRGPIVSMDILTIGLRVDSTKRDARMVLCLVSIIWHIEQLYMNCLTWCRKLGHFVPSVS